MDKGTDHSWPLRRRLPAGFAFFTKTSLLECLDEVGDDEPIWLDNYWQPIRQITQRPLELIYPHDDGLHLA
ncbi:hypothetical protein ACFQ23_00615 [Schaalia naturae]|uniref:Uncharacterized protein n=1 Tax=Schaalia naturae TaxID=635203 RepID=A0ABW2SMU8_9ACTO